MHHARELRLRLGWSQPEMGRYLGVEQATVSRIESGHATSASVSRLLAILQRDFAEGRIDAKPRKVTRSGRVAREIRVDG